MKNFIKSIIILGIIWLLFSICYFVIPIHYYNSTTYGLSYIFIVIAFLVQIYPLVITFIKSSNLRSKLYSMPLIKVGIIYLIVQMLFGIALWAINSMMPVATWIPIIVSLIFIGFTVIGFIGAEAQKEEIENIEKTIEVNTIFIDDLKANSKSFSSCFNYEPLKNKVKKLHELILYSDPVSSPDTASVENEITTKFTRLQKLYLEEELEQLEYAIDELVYLMNERNSLCKSKKK